MPVLSESKLIKVRFSLVGVANTLIDFGTIFFLTSFGLPIIPANIISTSTAFCFSFFANKRYTFKTTNSNIKREMFLFTVITLFGLWVIQGVIIKAVLLLAGEAPPSTTTIIATKSLASIISLVWNYLFYSRVVFPIHKAD